MNHFTLQEWNKYKLGQVSETDAFLMGNHLLECTSCLDRYTNLINSEDVEAAGKDIPDDFMISVMTAVKKETVKKSGYKSSSRNRPRQLTRVMAYYAAVAAITLVLTGTGVFDRLLEESSGLSQFDIKQYQENERSRQQMEMKWTNKLSNFMQVFELMEKRGSLSE